MLFLVYVLVHVMVDACASRSDIIYPYEQSRSDGYPGRYSVNRISTGYPRSMVIHAQYQDRFRIRVVLHAGCGRLGLALCCVDGFFSQEQVLASRRRIHLAVLLGRVLV
ncbi:hypothetical protein PENSPDRAFT_190976 [Peniophora sp. CONT]|nr:hypothetical protein PENSPDRAFT_190976 [Peniophora sp. CONT]